MILERYGYNCTFIDSTFPPHNAVPTFASSVESGAVRPGDDCDLHKPDWVVGPGGSAGGAGLGQYDCGRCADAAADRFDGGSVRSLTDCRRIAPVKAVVARKIATAHFRASQSGIR